MPTKRPSGPAGLGLCHVPSDLTGAPKCTGNRYVLETAVSAPWCTCTTLEGVECQNSSGAKHRSCTATKLNARSCLYSTHRSRGLHSGYKLPCRLLGRTIGRAFTDTQRRGNLLGGWRLQEVLKVTVLGYVGYSLDEKRWFLAGVEQRLSSWESALILSDEPGNPE